MNKIILATVALATFGFAGVANAADRPSNEEAGYGYSQPAPTAAPVVIEGRNAAAPAAVGVESYITNSVQQDARSTK